MKYTIFFILTLLSLSNYAQSDQDKAYDLGMEAITKMESGYIAEAIDLLERAKELDPENINYPYEIAYAHYLDGDYKSAINVLKELTGHPQVNDRIYQMLGNCYDLSKKSDKAISTYEEGLEKFPESGGLYLERANMEMISEKYTEALKYYEKGIAVAPTFPSNYYWASKIYLGSDEEVWGMIYGELFVNLEPNTQRTQEISKLLYDTYQSEITLSGDSTMIVSFSKNAVIRITDQSDSAGIKLPFGIGVYEPLMLMSVIGEKEINLESLDRIRTKFLQNYLRNDTAEKYPIVLFDYQKEILDAGHFSAYNHWLLLMGDEDGFVEWHNTHQEQWDAFVTWFSSHPIEINAQNKFTSGSF